MITANAAPMALITELFNPFVIFSKLPEIRALDKVRINVDLWTEWTDYLTLYTDMKLAGAQLNLMNGKVLPYEVLEDDCTQYVDVIAQNLVARVKEIHAASGKPVFLVAHSKGGLIVRRALQYLQKENMDYLVPYAVLLGTPNHGSFPKHFQPLEEFRYRLQGRYDIDDIFPERESEFIRELNTAPLPSTKIINVYSLRGDWYSPPETAYLEGVVNEERDYMTHTQLLRDRTVQGIIVDAYPTGANILYLHGQNNILSMILEGTILYPRRVGDVIPGLYKEEMETAQEEFNGTHLAIAKSGKMQVADLRKAA